MKGKLAIAMFGQKRLSREGGIEIVVKELYTKWVSGYLLQPIWPSCKWCRVRQKN